MIKWDLALESKGSFIQEGNTYVIHHMNRTKKNWSSQLMQNKNIDES